ncbi:DUF1800 family protein [Octadecabacter sp. R77987]|uniref:DUF1800 domain-containing protein n=1 Tax=Octadecabacter sp. R77987 TaxID=3093874 RepID=UPI00366B95D8
MPFDPIIAEIRFGMGLSPRIAPPQSVDAMLVQLRGPDNAAARYGIPLWADTYPSPRDYRDLARVRQAARGTDREEEVLEQQREMRAAGRDLRGATFGAHLARAVMTRDGMRERLTRFWADHFTVRAVTGVTRHLVSPYVEEAIRPHVMGRFSDMLRAVTTHPMMLVYLDQHLSMGPNSRTAQRRNRGLNENLARELLELHTLGVGASYDQTDVRELAELLTGLSYSPKNGFAFLRNIAEPGPEVVLGQTYGGDVPRLADILAALDDLAAHPDTARHIGRKLAVHFVADDPPASLVDELAAVFADTGGDLGAVVAAMLRHPAAWDVTKSKVKPPYGFVASAVRALDIDADTLAAMTFNEGRAAFGRHLAVMGQPWEEPVGPDGWPEDGAAWITPQGMAGRITWSMIIPQRLREDLPDPRDFVLTALGPAADPAVVFAAGAAEDRADGVGLVLASAAFQRR